MRPTVAFTPMYQFFSIAQKMQRTRFLISIHTLFNNRNNRILPHSVRTNIYPMQVTAFTWKIETVIVTQPDWRLLFHITLFLQPRTVRESQSLIFISVHLYFFPAVVTHIKQIQMFYRSFFFTRHLIFISFQGRTRLCHRVNHPQLFYGPVIGNGHCKMTGVGRPHLRRLPLHSVSVLSVL